MNFYEPGMHGGRGLESLALGIATWSLLRMSPIFVPFIFISILRR